MNPDTEILARWKDCFVTGLQVQREQRAVISSQATGRVCDSM